MPDRIECVVIGAGVVGLATARALARSGREVTVLEAETTFGTHTSSRNSEVIHAGIYYPPGSNKARMCVEGKRMLYAYCEEKGIPHRRLGKLVVATKAEEIEAVRGYLRNAQANGVEDLVWLDSKQIHELEPQIVAAGGFFSPSTGIVDSHALMLSLLADAQSAGAQCVFKSPVLGGSVADGAIRLRVGGSDPVEIEAREVVNAAGLFAQRLARSIEGLAPETIPPVYYLRGHYFALAGVSPFRHLVYPKAGGGGLGIHVTLDLAGCARFGPDASEWSEAVDYGFNESLRTEFARAIAAYYPAIDAKALHPAYVGIRPKLVPKGRPDADFCIQGPREHGVHGFVQFFGIESPGLTSALRLAEEAARLL
ncbi:MAG TPA: NAD(P)/FAD-dependent oxidoreductase [Burkholderiaceae bacterium]|nr:NAD(P)/FAD-dependent oxidoreductase [Burkholderiaceae bacterium]